MGRLESRVKSKPGDLPAMNYVDLRGEDLVHELKCLLLAGLLWFMMNETCLSDYEVEVCWNSSTLCVIQANRFRLAFIICRLHK